MVILETTDANEVRRYRRMQYSGMVSALKINGVDLTGFVTSVLEREQGKWTVRIKPAQQRATSLPRYKSNRCR